MGFLTRMDGATCHIDHNVTSGWYFRDFVCHTQCHWHKVNHIFFCNEYRLQSMEKSNCNRDLKNWFRTGDFLKEDSHGTRKLNPCQMASCITTFFSYIYMCIKKIKTFNISIFNFLPLIYHNSPYSENSDISCLSFVQLKIYIGIYSM